MYINKKEEKMILAIINEYLSKYSWKDLEIFREKIINWWCKYEKLEER